MTDPRTAAAPALPAGAPRWAMLARTGSWQGHPDGPETITPRHLAAALDYYRRHYAGHGADVVVDYHHASVLAPRRGGTAPAAGWVQDMELRADGTELWGRLLWTADAAQAVSRREFRHLSPVLRFHAPDRVSGRPVLMHVHSLALTNTPFLTELTALNHSPAADDGGNPSSPEGGDSMSLIEQMARCLELEPHDVAQRLGLEPETADDRTARALMDLATRPAPATLANALDLPDSASSTDLRAAVIRMKEPAQSLAEVRKRLGLAEDAPAAALLNAVDGLLDSRRDTEAEALVDEAVAEGRIPPAHREFYLREARRDPAATRQVINSMDPVLGHPHTPRRRQPPRVSLADAEADVCRQLGITPEAFARARTD
jgi:phage I-like protein